MTANDRVFEAAGTGRARLSIQIYPAVAGEVTEVLFETQDREIWLGTLSGRHIGQLKPVQ